MATRHDITEHTRPQASPSAAQPNGTRAPQTRSLPAAAHLAFMSYERRSSDRTSSDPLGHRFQNQDLLTLALTHRSLAYETDPSAAPDPSTDNEQLEFIGDAVLGLVVAEALYRRFPASREGELTRLRASLVSSRNLGQVGLRIGLGNMLRLGRGEEQSGGRRKPALLANAMEAIIAALYLDGGLPTARAFIYRHIVQPAEPALVEVMRSGGTFSGAIGDYKSALQERLQAAGVGQPQYILAGQSGPDHQKRFHIEVHVADGQGGTITLAGAEGSTKKQAQQEAARLAFIGLISGELTALLPLPEVPIEEAAPESSL